MARSSWRKEKEIEIPLFRPVKVFDISQTDGKPLPELAASLSGNVQNYEVFMEALRRSAPVPIEFEPMDANMDGYFSSDQQRIAIREGMSEVQTVSAAVHETAHSKLHDPKKAEPEPTWKVVMVSDGGTKRDFSQGFATEAEANSSLPMQTGALWTRISLSGVWRWRKITLPRSRQRRTGILRKSRPRASPMRFASITVSRLARTASAISPAGARQGTEGAAGQPGGYQ